MKLISLLLVLATHAAHADPPRPKAHGGNSGGGGDLTVLQPMTEDELETFIRDEVTELATWYFTIFASPTREVGRKDNDITEKLIYASPNIFDELKRARIVIQKPACTDPNTGRARDAAADARTGIVCFSTRSILARTPNRILRSQVLGLAVHEFSHLVGFTEEEARLIGDSALATVSVDGTALGNFRDAWTELMGSIGDNESLREFSTQLPKLSPTVIALRVAADGLDLTKNIEKSYNFVSLFTLSPWPVDKRVKAMAAQLKAINLISYGCALPEVRAARDVMGCGDSWFTPDGPRTRSFADLMSDGPKIEVAGGFDVELRNLTTGDLGALKAELDDLLKLLGDITAK